MPATPPRTTFPSLHPVVPPRPVHAPTAREAVAPASAASPPDPGTPHAPPPPHGVPPQGGDRTPSHAPQPRHAPEPRAAAAYAPAPPTRPPRGTPPPGPPQGVRYARHVPPAPGAERHPQYVPPPPQAPPIAAHVGAPPASAVAPPPEPARRPRTAASKAATALCLVFGLGLLGGAVAGVWINHDPAAGRPTADDAVRSYSAGRELWHSVPVDTLFPPTVTRSLAGPGRAQRTWIRVGVAPPAGCRDAFDPLLAEVLAPVGCARLLRATYVDLTSSRVTTVGLLVTSTDAVGMRALEQRWRTQHLGSRLDLMPRPVPFPGTAAAGFGDKQRGSWTVGVSDRLPFVVYAVTGFADGRQVPVSQPAAEAADGKETTAPAQAGLGNDALALAADLNARLDEAIGILPRTDGGS